MCGVELERGWEAAESVDDFEEGFLLGFVAFCHVLGFGGLHFKGSSRCAPALAGQWHTRFTFSTR